MKKLILLCSLIVFTLTAKSQLQISDPVDSIWKCQTDFHVPLTYIFQECDSLTIRGSYMDIWAQNFGIRYLMNSPNFGTPTNIAWIRQSDGDVVSSPITSIPINFSQVTGGLGYTPINSSRTLTINGTTFDLSNNRSWNVGDIVSSNTYSNPSWITALAQSKITYTGITSQYVIGAGTFVTFPTIPTLPTVLTSSATLDFPNTGSGSASDLTMAVAGAAVGDVIALGTPNGSVPSKGVFYAWVSATDTVTVRYQNPADLTARNPASGSYIVKVFK